ncbi:PKD-like family lipoprotein [Aestuariibaculum suncheonense]|uniref:PKD-like family protein n=1 Tax=Aestuariibaculum suncheonense TaxID=1028745 RepID=A0A8J6Q4Z7_9FLAO|nr:PKD-like family lipoprotein [Aestuariibaculum suncheonense]MBD0834517.1 hypothetical protein [Aestuariibaculum suncheonense]
MVKNKIYKIVMFLSLCCLTVSCDEDLGNYDYNDINEVVFGGMEDRYSALLGERFQITPQLSFTQDEIANEDDYEYEWLAIIKSSQVLPAEKETFLGTEKDLLLDPVSLLPATYDVKYRVTDKNSGVQWTKQFFLEVGSPIYEGWMLLCDVDGTARLDMLSLIDGEYTPIVDVLDYAGSSLKLEGAPVNVYCYPYEYGFYGIYVTSEGTGTTKIHPETFDWKQEYYVSYEMVDPSIPTDFQADFIQRSCNGNNTSLLYKDGDLYYYLRVYQYRYSLPINILPGERKTFKVAPYVADCFLFVNILYDMDNQRFVRHVWNTQSCSLMPDGNLFDYNTGKDLVYMSRVEYNGGEVFSLLKDASDKLFLGRIGVGWFGTFSQNFYDEIPSDIAADMLKADHYAVSPEYGYIFYNVGSQLYQYDFNLRQSKLMVDKGNEEITLLQFDRTSPFDYSKKLNVFTYDAANENGAIETYTVPPVNGKIVLDERHDGFGRIVSASYRHR